MNHFSPQVRDSLRIQEEDLLVVQIEALRKKQYDAAANEEYDLAGKYKEEAATLQNRLDKIKKERLQRLSATAEQNRNSMGFNIHSSGKSLHGLTRSDTVTRLNELNSLAKLELPCVLDDVDEHIIEQHKKEKEKEKEKSFTGSTPLSPQSQRKNVISQTPAKLELFRIHLLDNSGYISILLKDTMSLREVLDAIWLKLKWACTTLYDKSSYGFQTWEAPDLNTSSNSFLRVRKKPESQWINLDTKLKELNSFDVQLVCKQM